MDVLRGRAELLASLQPLPTPAKALSEGISLPNAELPGGARE
jgi:hypothetical protein